MSDCAVARVPFTVSAADGGRVCWAECAYAPTLTATGFAIKLAAEIPISYELRFDRDAFGGNRAIADAEAVVLQPNGRSRFIGVPPAHW